MLEKDFIEFCNKYEKIIIYGAGMVGKLVYKRLMKYQLNEKAICFAVSDSTQNPQKVLGKSIYPIKALLEESEKTLVVIATIPQSHQAIQRVLNQFKFKNILKVGQELFDSLANGYITDFNTANKLEDETIDIVLMASDNNATSGAFLCMADLCEELNKKGIPTLIVLPAYGDGEEVLISKKLSYTYIPSRNWVYSKEWLVENDYSRIHEDNQTAIEELLDLCKKKKVQVIHNNTTYTYIGAVVAKQLGLPVVWHMREDVLAQGCDFIDREKALTFINESDKIIVVSQFIQDCIKGLNSEKVQIVYDGVDFAKYYVKRNCLDTGEQIFIVMVGAITPIKGQSQLIEAVHLLNSQMQEKVTVSFLGKGDVEYLNELYQKIENYQLQDNIRFLGMQSNVTKFYRDAEIAVVCSQAEPFGRVTIEAQFAGCVVIGAKTGATIELLEDFQTGLLYEYGNPKDLAEKIEYYISNREIAKEIARRGQEEAVKNYTKKRNAEEIIEVYQKCIMQKN